MRWIQAPFILLRLIVQSAFLALGQIWNNKVRAGLTALGIVISVASVTAVAAALTGLKANVQEQFESFGTNKIYIVPKQPGEGPMKNAWGYVTPFTSDLFDDLEKHCPSVGEFTLVSQFSRTVRRGDRSEDNVEILGVSPAWHHIENRTLEMGRSLLGRII